MLRHRRLLSSLLSQNRSWSQRCLTNPTIRHLGRTLRHRRIPNQTQALLLRSLQETQAQNHSFQRYPTTLTSRRLAKTLCHRRTQESLAQNRSCQRRLTSLTLPAIRRLAKTLRHRWTLLRPFPRESLAQNRSCQRRLTSLTSPVIRRLAKTLRHLKQTQALLRTCLQESLTQNRSCRRRSSTTLAIQETRDLS